MYRLHVFIGVFSIAILFSCSSKTWQWETLDTKNRPTARHEAGLIAYKDNLYLLGGRRINPTSVFNTKTNQWKEKSRPPIEVHHFQPVVFNDVIYIIGALTGKCPNEKPLDKVLVYDTFEYKHSIPEHRRRGGSGVVVYNDKIYLVGGIQNGHMNGFTNWLDEYNPKTGEWKVLEDAPFPRDHFQAVVSGDKLYAFAGRTTFKKSGQDMNLTLSHGNVFDFIKMQWDGPRENLQIPTEREGNFVFEHNGKIIVGGGESIKQIEAHKEVEAYDPMTNQWSSWPALNEGRHGTGFAVVDNYVYTASGCGNRGGEPELFTIERLNLNKTNTNQAEIIDVDTTKVYSQWHTLSLSFEGRQTSENDPNNPFLNSLLLVEFQNGEIKQTIRGFYAADGNAGKTSADYGNVWKVRFTPDKIGKWTYKGTLFYGKDIAI
ncbi:MAG: kelch repeat-containing protein, partial [Bacteroidota bacterium]